MIIDAETEKLETCPFCGGDAVARSDSGNFWVKCQNKLCAISPAAEKDLGTAVRKWNRRTN